MSQSGNPRQRLARERMYEAVRSAVRLWHAYPAGRRTRLAEFEAALRSGPGPEARQMPHRLRAERRSKNHSHSKPNLSNPASEQDISTLR